VHLNGWAFKGDDILYLIVMNPLYFNLRLLATQLMAVLITATSKASPPTVSAAAAVCAEQLSSCSCRLTDGQFIDLSPLQSTPGPAFNYKAADGYTYQFNPCLPFQCGSGQTDAAVCQEMLRIIYTYTDFGAQKSAKFGIDPTNSQLYLRYLSGDSTRTTTVNLVCDKNSAESSVSTQGASGNQLTMDLRSRYACPTATDGSNGGGMSGGDVLLIIFFCLVTVYLLAGILFNRYSRQRSGLQMVPNLEFWMSLPGLAADGAVFTFLELKRLLAGRCRRGGGESYDSI
ncbi:hypothetical protein BOX15_Mlig017316g1, partial [Macrostomum lignano]